MKRPLVIERRTDSRLHLTPYAVAALQGYVGMSRKARRAIDSYLTNNVSLAYAKQLRFARAKQVSDYSE